MAVLLRIISIFLVSVMPDVDCLLKYGCYGQSSSPCSQHTLGCPDGDVIAINDISDNKIYYGEANISTCIPVDETACTDSFGCCPYSPGDNLTEVGVEERLAVYRICSNQESCTLSSPYNADSNYQYIRYPYNCINGSTNYNILSYTIIEGNTDRIYIYLSAQSQPTAPPRSTCSCTMTSDNDMTVESTFINVSPEDCNKITFKSDSVNIKPICTSNRRVMYAADMLFTARGELSLKIENVTLTADDIIWIAIKAKSIHIRCSCSTTADTPTRTTRINHRLALTLGLFLGCLALIIIVLLVVYCLWKRKKQSKRNPVTTTYIHRISSPMDVNDMEAADGQPEHSKADQPDRLQVSSKEPVYVDAVTPPLSKQRLGKETRSVEHTLHADKVMVSKSAKVRDVTSADEQADYENVPSPPKASDGATNSDDQVGYDVPPSHMVRSSTNSDEQVGYDVPRARKVPDNTTDLDEDSLHEDCYMLPIDIGDKNSPNSTRDASTRRNENGTVDSGRGSGLSADSGLQVVSDLDRHSDISEPNNADIDQDNYLPMKMPTISKPVEAEVDMLYENTKDDVENDHDNGDQDVYEVVSQTVR